MSSSIQTPNRIGNIRAVSSVRRLKPNDTFDYLYLKIIDLVKAYLCFQKRFAGMMEEVFFLIQFVSIAGKDFNP